MPELLTKRAEDEGTLWTLRSVILVFHATNYTLWAENHVCHRVQGFLESKPIPAFEFFFAKKLL